jgi:DNA invertase Pin-like site-specific DNA recombinase
VLFAIRHIRYNGQSKNPHICAVAVLANICDLLSIIFLYDYLSPKNEGGFFMSATNIQSTSQSTSPSMTFAYCRVSSKTQKIDRQMEAFKKEGVEEQNIYIDYASGKDFDREAYQVMKAKLREGDLIIIESLDRFGRDLHEILDEWHDITAKIGADIQVLDFYLLNTRANVQMAGLLLVILAYFSELERTKIKERQRQGIEAAQVKGIKFGRPKVPVPIRFKEMYAKWRTGEYTTVDTMRILNLKKDTFYRLVRQHEKED